jgi:outer membrane usher protein
VVQPFYVSPRLLAAGLDNFTVEGGFLRQDYAQADDRYTMPYAGTVWQHGLSAVLTVTGRAAAGDRRQQTGAEADWVLGDWGLFSASAAASHTEAGWGGIGTLAFERVADPFSLSLRRRFATSAYGDLGRDPGSLHFSDAARLSYNARRAGVASLVYLSEQPWSGAGTRLAGLAYSVQLRSGAELFASWLHPVGGQGSDSIVAGLSIYFGGGTSAGAQWSRDGGSSGPREYVQHAPMGPLGWSWYASAEERTGGVRQAQASWASARGTLGAGWAGFDGHGAPSASAQTGLAWFDRDLYWTRPIQNSFAVVDAGGLPGVRVYRENQLVGQTDASGHLLVPDLLPYQANRLDIDDRDLPISLGLQSGSAVLAPQANAGVPLRFTVDTQAPVRFHLRNTAGEPVPAGAALLLDGQPLPLPLGYDGLVYAAIGDGRHTVEARWGTRYCKAVVVVGGTEAKVRPCR